MPPRANDPALRLIVNPLDDAPLALRRAIRSIAASLVAVPEEHRHGAARGLFDSAELILLIAKFPNTKGSKAELRMHERGFVKLLFAMLAQAETPTVLGLRRRFPKHSRR
jgi:hypothetical protein